MAQEAAKPTSGLILKAKWADFSTMSNGKLYKYPDPDKIEINEADFRLKFRKFREAVEVRFSPLDIFLLLPAWLPIFISEFKGLGKVVVVSGPALKGAYLMLIGIATFLWLYPRLAFRFFQKDSNQDDKWLRKSEDDPDKEVRRIKAECGGDEGHEFGTRASLPDLPLQGDKLSFRQRIFKRSKK